MKLVYGFIGAGGSAVGTWGLSGCLGGIGGGGGSSIVTTSGARLEGDGGLLGG
jgi:hypothetical protein